MKIIAITQRVDIHPDYDEKRDALDQRWWKLLNHCNLMPVIFPNDLITAKNILNHMNFDGIILTGGHQTPERSEVESLLITTAINNSLPLLGVCNGMQVIQNYFGIKLKKIADHIHHEQEILIHNQPILVNSYHDYGTHETTENIVVWAKAYDGIVKAIKHVDHPITGIMWHPERQSPFAEQDIALLNSIFNEAIA